MAVEQPFIPVQPQDTEHAPAGMGNIPAATISQTSLIPNQYGAEATPVKLKTLCLARSGDKGNTVNIGVIARSELIYQYLTVHLTARLLNEWFGAVCTGTIIRYELPRLSAFNFLLTEALDGGVTYSGSMDPQGKTFASALLDHELMVPPALLASLSGGEQNLFH